MQDLFIYNLNENLHFILLVIIEFSYRFFNWMFKDAQGFGTLLAGIAAVWAAAKWRKEYTYKNKLHYLERLEAVSNEQINLILKLMGTILNYQKDKTTENLKILKSCVDDYVNYTTKFIGTLLSIDRYDIPKSENFAKTFKKLNDLGANLIGAEIALKENFPEIYNIYFINNNQESAKVDIANSLSTLINLQFEYKVFFEKAYKKI